MSRRPVRPRLAAGMLAAGIVLLTGCSATASHPRTPAQSLSQSRGSSTLQSPQTTSAGPAAATSTATNAGPDLTTSASVAPGSQDPAGSWNGTYASTKYPSTRGTFHVNLAVAGNTLTGTVTVASNCVSTGTLTGHLVGNRIAFGAVRAAEAITFEGTFTATTMTGTYHSGSSCGNDVGTWAASRA